MAEEQLIPTCTSGLHPQNEALSVSMSLTYQRVAWYKLHSISYIHSCTCGQLQNWKTRSTTTAKTVRYDTIRYGMYDQQGICNTVLSVFMVPNKTAVIPNTPRTSIAGRMRSNRFSSLPVIQVAKSSQGCISKGYTKWDGVGHAHLEL